nr:hypothetical protein [Marseillevirus cajuinensis]
MSKILCVKNKNLRAREYFRARYNGKKLYFLTVPQITHKYSVGSRDFFVLGERPTLNIHCFWVFFLS